jgi:succinoglycan biosynthesis transport protein ExoP
MDNPAAPATEMEIDLRALFSTLLRKLPYVLVFVLIVAVGTFVALKRLAPTYTSETTILIQPGESSLAQATQVSPEQTATALDQQAITSQVQLIRSRDLAANVSAKLDLAGKAEFNPALRKPSLIDDVLARMGMAHKPSSVSVEDQVLRAYYDKLSVYTVAQSRVIAIDFSSTDPQLAADAANAIADGYIALQRQTKRDSTADAAKYLSAQIADLRTKVKDAEAKVEEFRSQNDLFNSGGTANMTLPQQQLGDLSTELSKVRSAMADARAKADQIRAALKAGVTPNVPEVINSPLIQRLIEQEVALRAQVAQVSVTLGPEHPRMRELNAQVADLERQIASESRKIVGALDAEVSLAQARERELNDALSRQKVATGQANDAGVELAALQREAAAQRDLLDVYLRRYREAASREQASLPPADARVISTAPVPNDASFPKVVPMTGAAAAVALILAVAFVLLRELASGRPMRRVTFDDVVPMIPDAIPVRGHLRWADDHSVRRMMPAEPTLVPNLVDRAEESLAAIGGEIIGAKARRVLVTLAEGADQHGRPLAAVALARALARSDLRTVVVDFRGDNANTVSMGEGKDLPGFSDLFDGEASFAQVIFRDRRSRVHFIPAGRARLSPGLVDAARMETILSALALTYDCVILDTDDAMISVVGGTTELAVVVSEFGASDPRTKAAFDRVTAVCDARILLLMVDPAVPAPTVPDEGTAAEAREAASAGAAA